MAKKIPDDKYMLWKPGTPGVLENNTTIRLLEIRSGWEQTQPMITKCQN